MVDRHFAARISSACNELDKTLDSELLLRSAYLVTPKRFPIESLLEKPAALLSADAPLQMPRISKFDFASGCKALAFSLPTAAAFHLLRCTEGMLRHYYETVVPEEPDQYPALEGFDRTPPQEKARPTTKGATRPP